MKRSRLVAGAGGAITGAGLLAIAVVGQWEGLRLAAYQDVVGVWTACYGETKGIRPGMKFTKAQCDTMFIESLTKHEAGLRNCLTAPDRLPEKTYVSFVSWTYNVGVGAACGSTLVRKVNAGDLVGACNELPRWNRAGDRVVKGLVNRRAAELKLCLDGVREGAPKATPVAPAKPAAPVAPVVEPSSMGNAIAIGIGLLLALGAIAALVISRRRK